MVTTYGAQPCVGLVCPLPSLMPIPSSPEERGGSGNETSMQTNSWHKCLSGYYTQESLHMLYTCYSRCLFSVHVDNLKLQPFL